MILVFGYRRKLCRALERLGRVYDLVCERKPRAKIYARRVIVAPVTNWAQLELSECYQAVLAATEKSVLAAAHFRERLSDRVYAADVARRCHDKFEMKTHLTKYHVPMGGFEGISDTGDTDHLREIFDRLGSQLVLKKRNLSGSRGMRMVSSWEQFRDGVQDGDVVETFVHGREWSVESFVSQGKLVFQNVTCYHDFPSMHFLPGLGAGSLREEILFLNQQVIRSLGISWGVTHMECFQTEQGILFGEIALRPPGGHIFELIKRSYDFDPWEAWINVELGLPFEFPRSARAMSGVVQVYLVPGTVSEIPAFDLSAWRHIPHLKKIKILAEVGQTILPRKGINEIAGYAIFSHKGPGLASARSELIESMKQWKREFRISVSNAIKGN